MGINVLDSRVLYAYTDPVCVGSFAKTKDMNVKFC
jgi:hypothetical protein